MKHLEHQHQCALVKWWDMACGRWGCRSNDLYAVPNGGKRNAREAVRLKQEGVRAGQPDLNLDVARGGYHGLRIELKSDTGRATKLQKERLAHYAERGYKAEICKGWHQARKAIEAYMALNKPTG